MRATREGGESDTDGAANGGGGARYSWNDPQKTRCLIALASDVLRAKHALGRYITSREWEVLVEQFNRAAPEPVDNVKILHNRMAILRAQCKEYHEVVLAARARPGGKLDDAAWDALVRRRPAVAKWRQSAFEFYREMAACLGLADSDADRDVDADAGVDGSDARRREDADSASDSCGQAAHANAVDGQSHPRRKGLLDTDTDTAAAAATLHATRRKGHTPSPPYRKVSRATRRRVQATTSSSKAALSATAAVEPVKSVYPLALEQLAALQLPLEDRVDAKRFLVDERDAKVFIHMDEEEQRAYLAKYCFERRDSQSRYRFE